MEPYFDVASKPSHRTGCVTPSHPEVGNSPASAETKVVRDKPVAAITADMRNT